MSDELNQVSAELLARIVTQQMLPPESGPTHELGGVARASALLEKLLRLVLKDVANTMGTTADALIVGTDGDSIRISKATGGRLSRLLIPLAQKPASARPSVRMVIKEVSQPNNRIHRILEARNKVIHGSDEPASARAALAALRSFIQDYRCDAGWDKPGQTPQAIRRKSAAH